MSTIKHISRSIDEPIRGALSLQERWRGEDRGLISCWERGRQKGSEDPVLSDKARRGELPMLGWTGGVSKLLKTKKYGSLNYLAQWQGLREEDLDIYTDIEIEKVCAETGMHIIFTGDTKKFDHAPVKGRKK